MIEPASDLPTTPSAWVRAHPIVAFFAIAYAISWSAWISAAMLAPAAAIAHYAGAFGPWVAAILMVAWTGRSVGAWLVGLAKWRLHPKWYAFALGFPVLLVALASLGYVAIGGSLDVGLLPSRLAAYLPTLALMAVIGGGNEEPGWRGFALPRLQHRFHPALASLLLGTVWALWHAPLLLANPDLLSGAMGATTVVALVGVTFVSITAHAFWYTWLYNRTGSVLLCVLLHASYNTTNGLLILMPAEALEGETYQTLLALMTSVLVGSVLFLLTATRWRLGKRR